MTKGILDKYNMFYVYFLIDPKSGLPFYIGKGQSDRCYQHLRESYTQSDNKRKWRKIQSIRDDGLEPVVEKYIETDSEDDALNIEKLLISQYGRKGFEVGGILTNLTAGGDGISGYRHTPETKNKIAELRKSQQCYPLSEETKQKISQSTKGRSPNITPERNAKISATMRSDEWRAKNATKIAADTARVAGRKKSENEISKIRAKLKGRIIPPDERAKMLANKPLMTDLIKARISQSKKGRPWSEARKQAQERKRKNSDTRD